LKLSKKFWIILTVIILIITFAGLGVARSQQVNEQKRLIDEFSLVELRLNGLRFEQLSSQQKELEEQLSQTISQFETASATSPQPIRSVAINDTLLDIAKTSGVEIIEISSSGPVSGELEGITCRVLTVTARVEGDAPNLISFTINLIDDLTNGVVKSVEINIPKATKNVKPTANIKLAIYSYQGD